MNQITNLMFDPAVSGRRAYGLVWAAWGAAGLLAGPTLWLFRAVEVEGGWRGGRGEWKVGGGAGEVNGRRDGIRKRASGTYHNF